MRWISWAALSLAFAGLSLAADGTTKGPEKPAGAKPAPKPANNTEGNYGKDRQAKEDAERAKAMQAKKPTPKYSTEGWKMVWSDEFDGDKLDPKVWGYEIGFVRNQEPQYYTDRPENVLVKDGVLTLTARREKFPNAKFGVKGSGYRERIKEAQYTSGSVTTQKLHSFQYGRLEIRAQMPKVKGMWPALWLLGDCISAKGDGYMDWPACGEIDLLEIWCSRPDRITSCLHSSTEPAAKKAPHKAFGGGDLWHQQPWDGFHTYTLDWDKDWMYMYFDGKPYGKADLSKGDWKNGDNPFRHSFFLIMNLALGGYGNKVDDKDKGETTPFPCEMKIDWVRYYQKEGAAEKK